MSELTVILKDDERVYRHKFLCYEEFTVSEDDPFIIECIDIAKKSFGSEPEDITIKISLEL